MPYFKISKVRGGPTMGTVEGDDEAAALDAFAMKAGFWDFDDLAASMETSVEKARHGLVLRQVPEPRPGEAELEAVPELAVM